jgi:hypothetical protein
LSRGLSCLPLTDISIQVCSFVAGTWLKRINPFSSGVVLLPLLSSSNSRRCTHVSANIRHKCHCLIYNHLSQVNNFLRTIDHVKMLHWNDPLGCRFDCHLYKYWLMRWKKWIMVNYEYSWDLNINNFKYFGICWDILTISNTDVTLLVFFGAYHVITCDRSFTISYPASFGEMVTNSSQCRSEISQAKNVPKNQTCIIHVRYGKWKTHNNTLE